ncbi:MAG: hypothetical protein JO097_01160 [Acidobacteriaceae bacterium]|nr:hypothetical protein [Acidobacteriaceae bacterium]MBV9765026.1 hypothetical protein [Acidobacteriaceae bacterium]
MESSSGSHSHEGQSPAAPTNITALATRIIVSALESAGYTQAATLIQKWPELIGKEIGKPIRNIRDKQAKGEIITTADKQELNIAIQRNPREAELLLGPIVASSVDATLTADDERHQIFVAYTFALNAICEYMTKAKTSLALRGFLHSENCISYWHLTGTAAAFSFSSGCLAPIDFQIYLLDYQPSSSELATLNEEIRRNSLRHLSVEKYDYEKDQRISLVTEIHELKIRFFKLHPKRHDLIREKKASSIDYSRPTAWDCQIPIGAPALLRLFESLFEAKVIQQSYLKAMASTTQAVQAKKAEFGKK